MILSKLNLTGTLPLSLRFCRAYSAKTKASKELRDELGGWIRAMEEAGSRNIEPILTSRMGPEITLKTTADKKLLNFCANNYLGLATHPEVIKAIKDTLDKYGAGMASVRFICGTNVIHNELEDKIAKFHDKEAAALYASCFDANAGIFEVITNEKDVVLSDSLNHASIIDGSRLCKAKKIRYNNNDMKDLEDKLKQCGNYRRRVIVTDGVFSLDGIIVNLPKLTELSEKYDCVTVLDDAHGTGVLGKNGRGTEEYYGWKHRVTIINSTLGKAIGGGAGGFTAGPKELIDVIRVKSRSYLYTNAIPPTIVACASKSLDIISKSTELVDKLHSNANYFRSGMQKLGYKFMGKDHPALPIIIGETKDAVAMARRMREDGIFLSGFGFPHVPQGTARVRVQMTAIHTKEQIDRLIATFAKLGKELKLI